MFAQINPGKSQTVAQSIAFCNILRLKLLRFDRYNLIFNLMLKRILLNGFKFKQEGAIVMYFYFILDSKFIYT